jgi:hypothetical protein
VEGKKKVVRCIVVAAYVIRISPAREIVGERVRPDFEIGEHDEFLFILYSWFL